MLFLTREGSCGRRSMSIKRHILSGLCVLPFASAALAADQPAGHRGCFDAVPE
jgi:hypothetical protein